MSKRKCKKVKIELANSELRVFKDGCRPTVFENKKWKSKMKKKNWMREEF